MLSPNCFENECSEVLMNDSFAPKEQECYRKILEHVSHFSAHFWLATSGSYLQKWVGLSKKAVLASAASVNIHLDSSKRDIWVNPLPLFHVGGLGIAARAYLSGAAVKNFRKRPQEKWDAVRYCAFLEAEKATLSSLVPAQIYDLVKLQKKAPSSLRAVIVGGGALSCVLYERARALHWPLLPSYGLTECASQVATATLSSLDSHEFPALSLLSHIEAKTDSASIQGRLCFAGSSLLSTYAYINDEEASFVDPKKEGWFCSEDRGEIMQNNLLFHGRSDALIKIGGENVDLAALESKFTTLALQHNLEAELALLALPDERLGHVIHLAITECSKESLEIALAKYHSSSLPFEKIRHVHFIEQFPKSALGKVLRGLLYERVRLLQET